MNISTLMRTPRSWLAAGSMLPSKVNWFRVLTMLALAGAPSFAAAQSDYPSKLIRVLVGYPAGGTTDLLARALAHEAKKSLGQELIVINKTGASATLAISEVIAAIPDGYTLGVTPSGPVTVAHFYLNIASNLLEGVTTFGSFARMRSGLIVKGDSPLRSVVDFIEYARRNPGKASIGITGVGSKMSVGLRLFVDQEKLDTNLVPFQGDAPAATALLGGHVTAAAFSAASWAPHVRSGSMRVLASLEDDRFELAPNTPTLIEAGYPFSITSLVFAYGPKGLPASVGKRLSDAFAEASRSPTFIDVARRNELAVENPLSAEALERWLIKDRASVGVIVEKLGLRNK